MFKIKTVPTAVQLGLLFCLVMLSSIFCFSASAQPENDNPLFKEVYRIKIWNEPDGTIEVSTDKGKNWDEKGSVVVPSQKINPEGFAATQWAENGKVAAVAVNAIHIKTSSEANGRGDVFSILPREFNSTPKKYKYYLNKTSSIQTDIPAGESIFGGHYSPFVGNKVLFSRNGGAVAPIPIGYIPQVKDKIYIIVEQPTHFPREMVFENNFGGKITVKYRGGTDEKIIGEVLRPVAGVGRFEGTRYASIGRIRANHSGVIDVSTSRIGKIGGFQIVPAQHASDMKVAREGTQWLVIGPTSLEGVPLEGTAPFFKYYINPNYVGSDLSESGWRKKLLDRFLVEVKMKGSDKWQPMPLVEISEYYQAKQLPNWANTALTNVASIRILFPIDD